MIGSFQTTTFQGRSRRDDVAAGGGVAPGRRLGGHGDSLVQRRRQLGTMGLGERMGVAELVEKADRDPPGEVADRLRRRCAPSPPGRAKGGRRVARTERVEGGDRPRCPRPASAASWSRASSPAATGSCWTGASTSAAAASSPRSRSIRARATRGAARPGSSSTARRSEGSSPARVEPLGGGGEERLDEALDRGAALGAGELGDHLPVAEGLDRGDAADAVALLEAGVGVDVDLGEHHARRDGPPTTCSRTGPSARQGAHHAAQKSTTTGVVRERSSTSWAKEPSVTSMAMARLYPIRAGHAPCG